MTKHKKLKLILGILLFIVLVGVLYFVLQKIDERDTVETDGEDTYLTSDNDIIFDGKIYELDHPVKSYLIMGTDGSGNENVKGEQYEGSMADFLMLMVIDEADKRISGIIHGYDGNPTFSPSNFEPLRDTGIAMDAGGRFLDQLESKYTDACVEDITITSIEPEKEGEEPTELVETGHLGIKVEEIRESYASKYAEKYSAERMAEKAGNADGLE